MKGSETLTAFQTTRWTIVARASSDDESERTAALRYLAETYWSPVYSWLRRSGQRPDEAADVTQAFFADVLLDRRLLDRADAAKGRLRTLLLVALKRYLVDQHRRRTARHESGPSIPVGEFEQEERLLITNVSDPDRVFDQRWALSLLREAMRRSESQLRAAMRAKHWEIFETRVIRPSASCTAAPLLSAIAERHGCRSAADAAAVVQSVKKRVLTNLREIIAETADDPARQEEEYQLVLALAE
jgi:RNA polymerase sigma-70 factor (ECF subfamily)